MTRTGTGSLLLFFQAHPQLSNAGRDASSTMSGTAPTLAAQPPDRRTPPAGQRADANPLPARSLAGGSVNISSSSMVRPARGASARGHSQDASALDGEPSSHERMRARLEIAPAANTARYFTSTAISHSIKEGLLSPMRTRYLADQTRGAQTQAAFLAAPAWLKICK